ncbi:hypothetical protein QUF74_14545 [Candidatus Halobeggiatoa sp. HSG11]|nr:hypothetical protein [Candidatus Halobeggiatoa sp. HSG11]
MLNILNQLKEYFSSKTGNFFVGVIGIVGAVAGIIGIVPLFIGDEPVVPTEVVQKIMVQHEKQLSQANEQLLSQEELNKQLVEVVQVLLQSQRQGDLRADEALQQLQVGNTGKARAYFGKWTKVADNVQAANGARHAGTLAYLSSVDEAVKIYNESIQLDPNNPMSKMLKSYIEARKASTHILTTGTGSPVLKDVATEGDINITVGDTKK